MEHEHYTLQQVSKKEEFMHPCLEEIQREKNFTF